jgi:molecular chaperone DnaJ
MSKNYYDILGVAENADAGSIKKAYRSLAKQFHPDTHPGDKAAEERFKEISEAYNVLSDAAKKQKYDQMRKYGFSGGGPGGQGFDFSGFDFGNFRQAGRSNGPGGFVFEGFNMGGGLGDILSQFFGGAAGVHQTRRTSRTDNHIRADVKISSEVAAQGGKVQFSLQKEDTCPSCQGGGAKPGSRVEICPVCHGTGQQSLGGFFSTGGACPQCNGRGKLIHNPCDQCGGSGKVKRSKTYSVKVQPGMRDGEQIRLRGQGKAGSASRPAGDLIVTVRVQSGGFFHHVGNDVYCEVPLSLKQAYNGSKIRVKTPKGVKVQVTVPPKTKDGTQFRLAGMGLKRNGKTGDQFVKVKVKRPDNPAAEELTMMEEISS